MVEKLIDEEVIVLLVSVFDVSSLNDSEVKKWSILFVMLLFISILIRWVWYKIMFV